MFAAKDGAHLVEQFRQICRHRYLSILTRLRRVLR